MDLCGVDAPMDHYVDTVRATVRAGVRDNRTIVYSILPDSIRAVDKFNDPVTSPSAPYDYTVCSTLLYKHSLIYVVRKRTWLVAWRSW